MNKNRHNLNLKRQTKCVNADVDFKAAIIKNAFMSNKKHAEVQIKNQKISAKKLKTKEVPNGNLITEKQKYQNKKFRMKLTEKRISKLEHRVIEMTRYEQRGSRLKKYMDKALDI